MLEKLSLNALDSDNHSSNISIESYNYSKETEKKCCERSILRIIKTSIRIQVALSEILLLENDPDCGVDGTIAFVYRDIKKEEAEEIEELKEIFSFIHKVHSEKGDLVAFEVYSPKPVAIKSFFRHIFKTT